MATCAVADEALAYVPRRPLMKINKKFALQLPKQDFYSFRLCTVDKEFLKQACGSWTT